MTREELMKLSDSDFNQLSLLLESEKERRKITGKHLVDIDNYKKNEFILKELIVIVEGLGKTLGHNFEIVLHNTSGKRESSIIAIANEHVTGRSIGSPSTDFLIEKLSASDTERIFLNYLSETKEGKKLKSSTILIRNEEDEVIGSLCINIDLTNIEVGRRFLEDLSRIENEHAKEAFPEDVGEFLHLMIDKSLQLVDKPTNLFDKEDKLKIVKYLNENRIFNIKSSVDVVAKSLNVSKFTIYNYLEEVNALAFRNITEA